MSADNLTVASRNFYERTKLKLAYSLALAAAGLMVLGFCSSAAGLVIIFLFTFY